jgi:hypothetical protein
MDEPPATPQPKTAVWLRGTSAKDAGTISEAATGAAASCAKLATGANASTSDVIAAAIGNLTM